MQKSSAQLSFTSEVNLRVNLKPFTETLEVEFKLHFKAPDYKKEKQKSLIFR